MKKNLFTKIIASVLVVAIGFGIIYNNGVIKSKANESTNEAISSEKSMQNDINEKEVIKKFRIDGVDITIKTEEELYAEFEKYENVDKDLRANILAKTDDNVLLKFINTENKQFLEIEKNVPDKSVFSESLEETVSEKYLDRITNVETTYYKRGNDGYKKVTTLINKYGGEVKVICIDESENNIVTRGETVLNNFEQVIYKDYGDRKYTYKYEMPFCSIQATFGYTLKYGCVSARYIKSSSRSWVSPAISFSLQDKDITKHTSNSVGDKISAYATFKVNAAPAFFGGYEVSNYEIRMNVIQGGDSNHTTICGMYVTHKAKAIDIL